MVEKLLLETYGPLGIYALITVSVCSLLNIVFVGLKVQKTIRHDLDFIRVDRAVVFMVFVFALFGVIDQMVDFWSVLPA